MYQLIFSVYWLASFFLVSHPMYRCRIFYVDDVNKAKIRGVKQTKLNTLNFLFCVASSSTSLHFTSCSFLFHSFIHSFKTVVDTTSTLSGGIKISTSMSKWILRTSEDEEDRGWREWVRSWSERPLNWEFIVGRLSKMKFHRRQVI